ncbi:MBL fold metallo-hydrolase [Patescibacteria group bacterium]|nr:MBL fold metallo-hydrolase [Patescibacteria group bacterium]
MLNAVMLINKVQTGSLEENCWILKNTQKRAVIIDPGSDAAGILGGIGVAKVEWILLTHSHSDHLGALAEIARQTGAPIAIHLNEAEIVASGEPNPPDFSLKLEPVAVAKKLEDGDILKFDDERIEVIHTPGHTQGSCCFRINNELFSGDTLFRENVGRTDLPGGDAEALRESLRKLLKLPPEIIVHPGHGENWTIGKAQKFHFPI